MSPLVASLLLVAQVVQQYQPDNAACRRLDTAAPACDDAYRLYDVATRCENAFDRLTIEKKALERKLQNHTTPPPPVVVIEEQIPTWVWVVGSVAVAGAFIGGAYTAMELSK